MLLRSQLHKDIAALPRLLSGCSSISSTFTVQAHTLSAAAASCSTCAPKRGPGGAAEELPKQGSLIPWRILLASFIGAASGASIAAAYQPTHCDAGASSGQTQSQEQPKKLYTKEEIALHNSPEKGVWVTYKDGVYDVTDFLEQHPGGAARLMLAAGGAIDPFWNMYRQHQTQEVRAMLEGYCIGKLEGGADMSKQIEDPYANEPERHPALIIRTDKPMNAETPPDILASSPITPTELFYVRNHLPVPHVDPANYSLCVEGEGLRRIELSLKDLQHRFKKHTVMASLQCSGNRRHELSQIQPIKGLDWDTGAIGTAVFSGARLSDVLRHAGLDEETMGEIGHVQFEGLDSDISGTCYGASIPADKATSRKEEVILAYEMNGRPLSLDHGFPVRVVVPGVTGARSVKWLCRIIASKEESQSHWQQKDYKSFSPSIDWDTVDWSSAPAIQETNVQSAICDPKPGTVLEGPLDEVLVSGYAFSGGGRRVVRVDVSADGGKTWTTADLKPADKGSRRGWAWTLWEAEVPVSAGAAGGQLDICCKATDESYNSQPDELANIWNLRGVLNNAVHHVKVLVQ